MLFQFHKGAIGVRNYATKKVYAAQFQFHKGAIGVPIDVVSITVANCISIP